MSRARSLVAALALLGLAACTKDQPDQLTPTAPEASASVVKPEVAADAATALGAAAPGTSSVCRSYLRKRERLGQSLTKTPGDQKIKDQVQALNAMIKEACS
jgi:hypothetical protein